MTLPRPAAGAPASGRGVPDVSGDASPASGYQVVVDGQLVAIGGTSAVAPLWAGLVAVLTQRSGQPARFLTPVLYGLSAGLHDVAKGDNDITGRLGGYAAGPGWDACTGLGRPDGQALLAALGAGSQAQKRCRRGRRR